MNDPRKIKCVDDIENTTKVKEIPTDPTRAICEMCTKEITTYVKTEFNAYSILLVILVLYFYPFYVAVPIICVLLPLFRNVIHSCPYCLDVISIRKFYTIEMEGKHFMLNYGKCLIILKQIYIMSVFIVLFLYGIYYNMNYIFSEESYLNNHLNIDNTFNNLYSNNNLTWEELIKDCGSNVIVENSARANEIFNRKYLKRVVEWKGYFLNAYVQQFNPFDFNPEHLVNLNVRMIPSESINNPDLYLSMDRIKYERFARVIRTLETGHPIKFKAEFESLGNEWKPHHLHLLHIEKTDDFIGGDEKIVLFKGINFNITGHLKNEKEMQKRKVSMEKEEEAINSQ